jgi:hypothetical protein
MSKKLFIGIVPLLATAAFAVTPAAAAPHWFTEKVTVVPAAGVPILSWGTLKLKSAAGEVSCENSVMGSIANPGGTAGAAGTGKTFSFATANCSSPTCTGVETVKGEIPNLTGHTWTIELEGLSPEIRSRQFGVDVVVKCTAPASEAPFVDEPLSQELAVAKGEPGIPIGTDFPLTVSGGPSKAIPGLTEFSPAGSSGKLCVPTESIILCGETTGHLKTVGAKNLELIGTGITAEGN